MPDDFGARARRRAEGADLTLWLDDGAGGQTPGVGSPVVNVRTKIDIEIEGAAGAKSPSEYRISAKTGAGVERLLDALADLAEERMSSREPALLTVERHRRAFEDAREALAATLGPDAAEWELVAEDFRRAAAAMDRVVGRIGAEEVLGEIFTRLCIGK